MLWQTLLTGLFLSADAWIAGAAYGRENIRTGKFTPFFAAGVSAVAFLLTGSFSESMESILGGTVCRWLGAGTLFALGLHAIFRTQRSERVGNQSNLKLQAKPDKRRGKGVLRFLLTLTVEQEHADMDDSKSLSATEGLLLGVAMSLDTASAGLGAPRETLWATGAAIFLATFAALTVGPRLGRFIPTGGRWLGGVCLLVLGIVRLV